jgi:hypothetical protein
MTDGVETDAAAPGAWYKAMIIRRHEPPDIAVGRPCRFEDVVDDLNDRPGPPSRSGVGSPNISG